MPISERRLDLRYPISRPAVLRVPSGDIRGDCTSVSLGGGFFVGEASVLPGQAVRLSIQSRRPGRPDIQLQATVAYVVRPGGVVPPGLGLRWLPSQNLAPLMTLLQWAAGLQKQGLIEDVQVGRTTQHDLPSAAQAEAAHEPDGQSEPTLRELGVRPQVSRDE